MGPDTATDREHLLGLQRGDSRALDRLMERWQRPLLGFARRYMQNAADADDLVAETFVRLYECRLRLRSDSNVKAWLFTTLTNLCKNQHRWRRRHPSVPLGPGREDGGEQSASAEPASAEDGPRDALVRDEELEALRGAIARLPHDLRTAVLLHHYQRLSYGEIAAVAGCSERGVETRLYRARQQLRDSLRGFVGDVQAG